MRMEEVRADFEWLESLPGTKVMIKGNHDYWWGSLKKVVEGLPPSVHVIQNNAFHWKNIAIGGARLWDTPEYSFESCMGEIQPSLSSIEKEKEIEVAIQKDLSENIFNRELERLKLSLKAMNPKAEIQIVMTHYPPIGHEMQNSRCSQILEMYPIQACVFGHLHGLKKGLSLFGKKNKIQYILTSCDYLEFQPIQIYPPLG
jgi:predicted phosphohydrolase